MIVMKFGGSSVASPSAMKRVAALVEAQIHREPVVVVSALADTTDQLASILKHARAAESYLAWKLIKEVREYHFLVAEELLGTKQLEPIDEHLRDTFRDLHVRMAEVCDGERTITAAEVDRTLSIGEQLSSLILSAAFCQLGMPCHHLDARKLILTDSQFTNATPRYWETYAKLRWTVHQATRNSAVVLGGFIGATEQGETTTLGRGGSDLTATIVGAAINAEEIQIWKDVDGILTADPRRQKDALLVKTLSYEEATELARAGSKILHPETIAPAQRLRIPIVLRNTFHPRSEATRITCASQTSGAKSIVCRSGLTLLEVSSARDNKSINECLPALSDLLSSHASKVEPLGVTDRVLYLAMDPDACHDGLSTPLSSPIQVHLKTGQSLITLVGTGVTSSIPTLASFGALTLPFDEADLCLRFAVPDSRAEACLRALHRILFSEPDPQIFAACEPACVSRRDELRIAQHNNRAARIHQALTLSGQLPI